MSDGIAELTALVAQLGSLYTEAAAKLRALSTPPPPPEPDRLLSVDEVAHLLGISRSTLYARLGREPYRSMVVEGGGIRRRRFYRSKVMLYINGGQGHE